MRSPGATTDRAVFHINHFGEGESAYISGSIFARCFQRSGFTGAGNPNVSEISEGPGIGVRWAGPFVKALVEYLAPNPTWVLAAPPQVWAGLNHQPELGRHVFHLVNLQPGLPARDLRLQIAADSGVGGKATVVWPTRVSLEAEETGSSRVFVIPEVNTHTIVTFQ
jgi:hypothetical protein